MTITDWPLSERPRERLLAHGAERLSDAELLAIFLRTGYRGRTALDLARELLTQFQSLSGIVGCSPEILCMAPGLGQAKVAQLLATVELSRRALGETLAVRNALTSPSAVRDFLRLSLASKEHEVFVAVFLDAQHRVICTEEMFRGSLTQTSVYPREVVKAALKNNAAAIIFAHNHPSGVAEPSHADEALTRSLRSALGLVDVRVLDHFIVAGSATLSFAERGLL